MEWPVLLAAVSFVVPGLLAVKTWDFLVSAPDREPFFTGAYAIVLSLLGYALFQSAGYVNLSSIADEQGGLSLTTMLSAANCRFYLLLCGAEVLGAGAFARWLYPRLTAHFGRSAAGAAWTDMWKGITKQETFVEIRTKSGWNWFGRPHLVPLLPEEHDYLQLDEARCFDLESGSWKRTDHPLVMIPMNDIEYIRMDKKPRRKDARSTTAAGQTERQRTESEREARQLSGHAGPGDNEGARTAPQAPEGEVA